MESAIREEQNLSILWLLIVPCLFFILPSTLFGALAEPISVLLSLVGGAVLGTGAYLGLRHQSRQANLIGFSLVALAVLLSVLFL